MTSAHDQHFGASVDHRVTKQAARVDNLLRQGLRVWQVMAEVGCDEWLVYARQDALEEKR